MKHLFKTIVHTYFLPCISVMKNFIRWILLAMAAGILVGLAASVFGIALTAANDFRVENPLIVLGLPIGGLMIVSLYHLAKSSDDRGTNTVILSLRGSMDIPFRMTPLIFCSTVITHLFGGSAGREGAALQLGGSIANRFGKMLRLSDEDRRILVMAGMSAAFSALFGTPLAAAVFSLEVVCVGLLQYSALVPCLSASLVGHFMARLFGLPAERFFVADVPQLSPEMIFIVAALAVLFAAVSILFCFVLHGTEHVLESKIKNQYARIFASAILLLFLSTIFWTDEYLGSGIRMIEEIFHHNGEVVPYAFLLKILFTALTLGAGFKGGEIVPSLTIGAACGCAAAVLFDLPIPFIAACGMAGVFCGVTNCPMTTLLISLELFGGAGMPYYFVAIAVSYMLSGPFSLYHTQHIIAAKGEPKLTVEPDFIPNEE